MSDISEVETSVVPKWIYHNFRTLAEKAIFLQDFPACRNPYSKANPFTSDAIDWHFVYMTNRCVRYTYLFQKRPSHKEVINFPIYPGYTQLWLLRLVKSFPAKNNKLFKGNVNGLKVKTYTKVGYYCVLQDPLAKAFGECTHNDVLYTGNKEECLTFAKTISEKHECGLLVAEIIENVPWH